MKARALKGTPAYYINSAIVMLLMLCFRFIPAPAPITQTGMAVTGVVIGTIWGWATVGMFWPSAMAIICMGFTGLMTVSESMITAFGHNNTLIVITMFGMLGVLESAGITRYISLKIVGSRLGNGRPWVLVYLMMLAACLLHGITGAFPVIFLVWSLFYNIVEANKIEKGPFTQFAVTAIAFGTLMGGQLFTFNVPVVMLMGAFTNVSGMEAPGFVPYFVWMLVVSQLSALLYVLFGKYILRIKAPSIDTSSMEKAEKLDGYQKLVFGVLAVFLLALAIASLLPASIPVVAALKNLDVKGLALLLVAILIALNFTKGKSFAEYMSQAKWELIFVIACVVLISGSLSNADLGIVAWVTQLCQPIFGGSNMIVFLILITVIPCILTNVLNNLVVGMLFIPIAYSFAVANGANPVMLLVVTIMSTSMALATPAACVPAAALHGNSEWVTGAQAAKYGIFAVLCSLVVILLVGIPMGNLLF